MGSMGWEAEWTEAFWNDENVLHLDWGDSHMGVCIRQNVHKIYTFIVYKLCLDEEQVYFIAFLCEAFV